MVSLYFLDVFIKNYSPLVEIDNSEGTGKKYNCSDENSAKTATALEIVFLK